jgi:ergothioneine biosynthesis protein EgtB
VSLLARYLTVRRATERLAEPLAVEDQVVQTMPDVSPTRWHLAHVSWFFETFLLRTHLPEYRPLDPRYGELFNSYYQTLGDPLPQAGRGQLSRPTVAEVMAYRRHVDAAMERLLASEPAALAPLVELGLAHEEQHQELILTDIKHVLATNPLQPIYRARATEVLGEAQPLAWITFAGGEGEVGASAEGFAFDNERPRHTVRLEPFQLASRPVTCGEYLAFMADGGYARHDLWLSDGWALSRREGWRAPLYWSARDGEWWIYTLTGVGRVAPAEPVSHLSYYEADAYARWAGARLPLEEEWEHAAAGRPVAGHFADEERWHPAPSSEPGLTQLFGDVWEWTASLHAPYPRYAPSPGAVGEYNGKFMANRMVLRGGSCASPPGHLRASYRNFFPPEARWQFSGLRLARW